MELLDVGLEEVMLAVAHISEISCPPYQMVSVWMKILEFADSLFNNKCGIHLFNDCFGL